MLNLSGSVILRQIIDQTNASKMWIKLNGLYEAKELPNKMFVRERFFTFKMNLSKTLTKNLEGFKIKIVFNLRGDNWGR